MAMYGDVTRKAPEITPAPRAVGAVMQVDTVRYLDLLPDSVSVEKTWVEDGKRWIYITSDKPVSVRCKDTGRIFDVTREYNEHLKPHDITGLMPVRFEVIK